MKIELLSQWKLEAEFRNLKIWPYMGSLRWQYYPPPGAYRGGNINSYLKSLNSALQVSRSFWVEASLSPGTTPAAKRELGSQWRFYYFGEDFKISRFQNFIFYNFHLAMSQGWLWKLILLVVWQILSHLRLGNSYWYKWPKQCFTNYAFHICNLRHFCPHTLFIVHIADTGAYRSQRSLS